jgi:Tfp pilus assembly protein FimT
MRHPAGNPFTAGGNAVDGKIPDKSSVGVTLIELMIVLVILGCTFFLVFPSMRNSLQTTRVQAEASRLMTAINLVRSEALRRNLPVTMCPSPAATTGERVCAGIYAEGWMIFTNRDKDLVLDEEDELIQVFEESPSGFTVTNRAGTRHAKEKITYMPDGTSGRNRTLLICPPPGQRVGAKSVVMNIVGRPRIATDWGVCPDR